MTSTALRNPCATARVSVYSIRVRSFCKGGGQYDGSEGRVRSLPKGDTFSASGPRNAPERAKWQANPNPNPRKNQIESCAEGGVCL
jgi:hypothetical protein